MSNSSIWPIDRILSGATTQNLRGPGNDSNEGVLCIPQSSNIAGASPSDCLIIHIKLYGFKYSNLIQIIHIQLYDFKETNLKSMIICLYIVIIDFIWNNKI